MRIMHEQEGIYQKQLIEDGPDVGPDEKPRSI